MKALVATGLHIQHMVTAMAVIMLVFLMTRNAKLVVEGPLKDGKKCSHFEKNFPFLYCMCFCKILMSLLISGIMFPGLG